MPSIYNSTQEKIYKLQLMAQLFMSIVDKSSCCFAMMAAKCTFLMSVFVLFEAGVKVIRGPPDLGSPVPQKLVIWGWGGGDPHMTSIFGT